MEMVKCEVSEDVEEFEVQVSKVGGGQLARKPRLKDGGDTQRVVFAAAEPGHPIAVSPGHGTGVHVRVFAQGCQIPSGSTSIHSW